jgi:hypothetical protein
MGSEWVKSALAVRYTLRTSHIICANSSQAKGRVERAHKTLQDR